MTKQKYLPGYKFEKLTILSRSRKMRPNGNYEYYATCKCECGTVKDFVIGHLISGRSTSCGCNKEHYKNMLGNKSSCFKGYKEIRGTLWSKYKKNAIKRNLDFLIDIKDAWELYEKQEKKCALTGIPIFFTKCNEKNTASLDRIDSLKGYTIDNIQWVHKDANKMKNKFNMKYFITICKLVSALIHK